MRVAPFVQLPMVSRDQQATGVRLLALDLLKEPPAISMRTPEFEICNHHVEVEDTQLVHRLIHRRGDRDRAALGQHARDDALQERLILNQQNPMVHARTIGSGARAGQARTCGIGAGGGPNMGHAGESRKRENGLAGGVTELALEGHSESML